MLDALTQRLSRKPDDPDLTGLKFKNAELLAQLRREQHKRRVAEAEIERLHGLLAASHSALLARLQ